MKKEFHLRWCLVLVTLAASIGGALARRTQLMTELLENGALVEGSNLHLVLLVLMVVFLAVLAAMLMPLQKKEAWVQVFSARPLPNVLQICSAAALVFGNVTFWAQGGTSDAAAYVRAPLIFNAMEKLLPPLGLLMAVCIAVFAVLCMVERKPSPLIYMTASVYLIVRLIVSFQGWNIDPSIHDYCFQLMAAICCMLATVQLAGFSFDRGRRRMCLYWCLSAVFFCGINLADTFLRGTLDEIVINLALLLFMAVSAAQLLFCGKSEK